MLTQGDLWELLRKEKLRSASPRSPPKGGDAVDDHSPKVSRGASSRASSPRGKDRAQCQWNGPRQRRSTLFSLRRQLTIFRHVFEALVYLHERELPVIHRDLKSANILVRYDLGDEDPVSSFCGDSDSLECAAVLAAAAAANGPQAKLTTAAANAAAERETRLKGALAPLPHDAALSAAEVDGAEGWRAKVTDFGLSRTAGLAEYVAMTCCGSPAWTAPEVFRGGQQYSTAVDVCVHSPPARAALPSTAVFVASSLAPPSHTPYPAYE